MVAVVAMIGADCGTNATSFCHNLCPGLTSSSSSPAPGWDIFAPCWQLVPMLELDRSRFQLSPAPGLHWWPGHWPVVPSSAVSWRQLSATSCYHQDTGRLRRIRVKGRESTSCSLLCYEQGQVSVLPVPCPQYEQVRGS